MGQKSFQRAITWCRLEIRILPAEFASEHNGSRAGSPFWPILLNLRCSLPACSRPSTQTQTSTKFLLVFFFGPCAPDMSWPLSLLLCKHGPDVLAGMFSVLRNMEGDWLLVCYAYVVPFLPALALLRRLKHTRKLFLFFSFEIGLPTCPDD